MKLSAFGDRPVSAHGDKNVKTNTPTLFGWPGVRNGLGHWPQYGDSGSLPRDGEHMRVSRWYKWTGLGLWAIHFVLAGVGVYRCPRCKGRLNYRWWCKQCGRYRLPAR